MQFRNTYALRFCYKENSCRGKKQNHIEIYFKIVCAKILYCALKHLAKFAKFHKKDPLKIFSLYKQHSLMIIMNYRDREIRLLDFRAPVQTHKCNPAVSVQSILNLFIVFLLPIAHYQEFISSTSRVGKICIYQIGKDVVHTRDKYLLLSDCLR